MSHGTCSLCRLTGCACRVDLRDLDLFALRHFEDVETIDPSDAIPVIRALARAVQRAREGFPVSMIDRMTREVAIEIVNAEHAGRVPLTEEEREQLRERIRERAAARRSGT